MDITIIVVQVGLEWFSLGKAICANNGKKTSYFKLFCKDQIYKVINLKSCEIEVCIISEN